MSTRSTSDYLSNLRDGREVYVRGELVDDVTSHPTTRSSVQHTAGIWKLQNERRDRFTYEENGERYSANFKVPRDAVDLLDRHELIEATTNEHMGVYNMLQTLGTDGLLSLLTVTPDVDEKYETEYTNRVTDFYERCRDDNLSIACAVTDPKGDRSKSPHEQPDPDLYLRIVDETEDGVVVRGAKMHNPAPVSDEILILPTRALSSNEKRYAVAAAIRPNADGVRMICRPQPQSDVDPRDAPTSSRHNEIESLTVFDDVFIPNERIFLRGEHDFTPDLVRAFATYCRFSALGHKASMGEHMIGAANLAAKFNGTTGATHVRKKMTEMMGYVLRVRAFARAAALEYDTVNGIAMPASAYCDFGKFDFATKYHRLERHLQDITGGVAATAPAAADLDSPETGEDVRKYMQAAVSGEDRFALATYVRDLTASDFAGWQELSSLHGGGSPEALLMTVFANWDLDRCEELVASQLDILE